MFRTLLALAAVALFAAAPAVADDEKKSEDKKPSAKGKAGKLDKSKAFERMDADKDGKVSKDEFKAALDKLAEKVKEKAGDKAKGKGGAMLEKLAEKAFEKLDADKDGSISKDEFEKDGGFDPSNLKALRAKFGKGK